MKKIHMTTVKILGVMGMLFALAANASAATLTLSPASRTVNVGDTFSVDVLLDTQGQNVDGVDLQALNYNPYYLQVQDADGSTAGTQIQPGTLMPSTLANSVDTTNGKIVFSQVSNAGSTYSGSGKLATVTFKALVAGNANVTFDYTQGATTDTNVASAGNDILSAVTNGQYAISNIVPPSGSGSQTPPSQTPSGAHVNTCLINDNGTFYLILNNQRHGITNPGMLYSYGYDFSEAVSANAADSSIAMGSLLLPADGALVKKPGDPTVYLISGGMKHGFTSASVFGTLGYKFTQVLTVTGPELDAQQIGDIISNPNEQHRRGADILYNGTVYWVGNGQRQGYPSLAVYNSWHLQNDFSHVVPANAADLSLTEGTPVQQRLICGQ